MSSSMLLSLSETLNTSEAALRLLISIFLGLPIALLHRYTLYGKCPVFQHIFFATCGVLICLWNYGLNILHSAAAMYVTYRVLKRLGGTSLSVVIIFVFNMAHLLCGYYMTSTDDYDIKWTMPQCVLTLRLIGLAFNLLDGQKPEEKLSASQKQVALKEQPTFLEIAAFAYFPGSFLVGPQFSMKRYLDYVNGRYTMIDTNTFSMKEEIELLDCIIPGISRMFVGFIYLIFYQLGTSYIPNQYLLSAEFREQTFLKRLFTIGFWGHFNLYKYISCWLLAEGVCTTFGLTYNGKDEKGRPLWNGCENVKLLKFETATQFNDYILSFNINTNNWCAEYIYKRLKFLGSKIYSQFFTLAFLAVWHGLHSGYYVCFFLEFIIMYAEKDLSQILKRQQKLQSLLNSRPELQILTWILMHMYTFIFMGYCLVCFTFLSYPRYHQVYFSIYYCGHIIYLSYPLISLLVKISFLKKRSKKFEQ
ncbi:lysophospholipid acyltransferase 5 isoform X1 [Bombus huntii]|uniref:lysophospholipid acyltransferase 5 isoform X1 n=2 Tax=Bombus huntii TaxID=85661 RepID=UPI0021A9B3C2|nr:lysophospholipid acyltransferase 5 isoform X1 [Bombus huntii]XP_050493530.1 lysophospholipid acyltransferase 5 isoform X1 [Bombus huntii]XP_050493531.1 lysophospholipid acyltransferase 5 isoform X1 [Bombus huntii]XP_050493533.1 lysophospholipid acyltransferase 5 isoform X1 [Bombus huntii]